jgi:glycosyltransferase involved in cell wall biosynthesis
MNVRVLHLARNYPNSLLPRLGLWTQRLVRCVGDGVERHVVSPVPYCPPISGFPQYARFRTIARSQRDDGIEVSYPRFVTGPGYMCHSVEGLAYYAAVARSIHRLRGRFDFNVIHAHFIYPDGFAAALIGRRYGVPVVVTEQAPWRPWMDEYPLVRTQAVWAARRLSHHIAVSHSLRDSIVHFTGLPAKVSVIPNVVDTTHFAVAPRRAGDREKRILFVGVVRYCKGVDLLFEALRILVSRGRQVRLTVVGDAFYEAYRRERERLQQMSVELGIGEHLDFVGGQDPAGVAQLMSQSDLLVLPSRAESFGAVLVEALACGIPVVATRCGGPEDIVQDDVGVLVPNEDPAALAAGIEQVLDNQNKYDAQWLSAYAVEQFGPRTVGRAIERVYAQVLGNGGRVTEKGALVPAPQ